MGVIPLTPNALTVLEKRYLQRDLYGKVTEKPEDMFQRVARNIAQADRFYHSQADLPPVEEEFYAPDQTEKSWGRFDERRLQRSCLLHERLRCSYRDG